MPARVSSPADLGSLIQQAVARREPLANRADLDAYRLVNGSADRLPGMAVDRFRDLLVLHVFDADDQPEAVVEALALVLAPLRAVYVKHHPPRASRLSDAEREHLAPPLPALGTPVDALTVVENGVHFQIRPGEGLSVGLFLDMREVRSWARAQAARRTVLNLFAYTCSFGVCAALGGAARVLNLDASKHALRWGQENYRLNGLDPVDRDFVFGDAYDWVSRLARRGERFDVVILDPPSFGTARGRRFAAERDYPRLVATSVGTLAEGGILLAATNHAGISPARFAALVGRGLAESGRAHRVVKRWHEPGIDFPVAPHRHPYLKVQAIALDGS